MEILINGTPYAPKRQSHQHRKGLPFLLKGLRELREETLEEASANIGISKSHLHGLEAGRCQPRLDTLQLLIAYYDIDFYEIA